MERAREQLALSCRRPAGNSRLTLCHQPQLNLAIRQREARPLDELVARALEVLSETQ